MPEPAGYSGTPLPRKLGIRPGSRLLIVGTPVVLALDPLSDGVELRRRDVAGSPPYDVVLAFCADRRALEARFAPLSGRLTTTGALWIGWPKKAGGLTSDLDESVVRGHGLAAGLVDVKVAAIDATWSGLKFVVRLRDRG